MYIHGAYVCNLYTNQHSHNNYQLNEMNMECDETIQRFQINFGTWTTSYFLLLFFYRKQKNI